MAALVPHLAFSSSDVRPTPSPPRGIDLCVSPRPSPPRARLRLTPGSLSPRAAAQARVRAIMAVSMLSATKPAAAALVDTPGAVAAVAALVRSKEDSDERSIAADLFTALLGEAELRDRVRAAAAPAPAPAS